jgi:hypothetical protein
MRVEYFRQVRQLENLSHMFGHVAQLQVSVHLAGAGQSADHCAQTTAINERDLAEVQHDGASVAQQPCYMCA